MPNSIPQQSSAEVTVIVFSLLSFVVFAVFCITARFGRILGPSRGRFINWVTFAIGVFIATFLFNAGLLLAQGGYVLDAFFLSIQMIDMGRDIVDIPINGFLMCGIRFYETVLYCLAPISFIGVIASYLVRFISLPVACILSKFRDTFILSDLNESTVFLARSIKDHYSHPESCAPRRKANIVFTSVHRDLHDKLQMQASEAGAISVRRSAESLWRNLSKRSNVRIVLAGQNEGENITRASSIYNSIKDEPEKKRPQNVAIYSIASLYGAESLLEISEERETTNSSQSSLHAQRFDWTRRLVESTLDKYPLFLLGHQPSLVASNDLEDRHSETCIDWQDAMYKESRRHVVIVGAGHVGMEFLKMALSLSRFWAPDGTDTPKFRFDVFDSAPYSMDDSVPAARRHFEAQMPGVTPEELQEHYNCHFHLTDVLGPEFEKSLRNCYSEFGGITYVLVALGDDLVAAQTSMRIRESLERLRVRKYSAGNPKDRQTAYLKSSKPIIITVIDDVELSRALESAEDDGYPYDIKTVGSPKDMYRYDRIFEDTGGKKEYKRRSSYASDLHRKYKLFAYERMRRHQEDMRLPMLDWTADYSDDGLDLLPRETRRAIAQYNEYIKKTAPLATPGVEDHEWLLRMEHERWNAYMFAEGFVPANIDEVELFFDTCQQGERHRLNGANLHPCIIGFDELPNIDRPIDEWYDRAVDKEVKRSGRSRDELFADKKPYVVQAKRFLKDEDKERGHFGKPKPFQLQDDDYIHIGETETKKAPEGNRET